MKEDRLSALVLLLGFVFAWSGGAWGRTINVPADEPTIQAGIDAASNSDLVLVAAGNYHENINFRGKTIRVTGKTGPSTTKIMGNGTAPVVSISSGQGVLSGFTITGGNNLGGNPGGGVSITGGSPSIFANVITGNYAAGGGGGIGVIYTYPATGTVRIESNTIDHNAQSPGYSGGSGGGIFLSYGSGAQVVRNRILNNSAGGDGGGIYAEYIQNVTIMDNLISGNQAQGNGGGLSMSISNPVLVQNLVINNSAGQLGGGVYTDIANGVPGPTLVNNTIAGNNSNQGLGSAVYVFGNDGASELFNNLLIAPAGQNPVYCDPTYSPVPPALANNDAFSPDTPGFEGNCSGLAGQSGNIEADPLFANIASNDYHLLAASSAIDAGWNYAPNLPSVDFYGNPRIVAGRRGDKPIVDMGIAEFQCSGCPTPTPTPVATPTPGRVINVPGDKPSIQAAIDAVVNGDVVRVAPGTYFEVINFKGKAIQVTSTRGPNVTTIDGHGLGSVVTFASNESLSSVLSGFTITGGVISCDKGFGGGIMIDRCSPRILKNVINNNYASSGGGIYINSGSPIVEFNLITSNTQYGCSEGTGGGILIAGNSTAQILSNTISNNSWYGGGGGGSGGGVTIEAGGSPAVGASPLLMDNLISGNYSGVGGGIYIDGLSSPVMIQNLIVGNKADAGGGVYTVTPSNPNGWLLINNTIAGNQITFKGSALYSEGFNSATELFNNLLIGTGGENAFYCGWGTPVFENNDVFSRGGTSFEGPCKLSAGTLGNISGDPRFVDVGAENYRLSTGSPAIDAGLNSAPRLPARDFYGEPRIVAGKPGSWIWELPSSSRVPQRQLQVQNGLRNRRVPIPLRRLRRGVQRLPQRRPNRNSCR